MSTHVTSSKDFTLQVKDNWLQIGKMSIPITTARHCSLYRAINAVEVCCLSMQGKNYGARITLELQSAEKVKECIKLLLSRTETQIFLPSLRGLKPDSNSIVFKFDSETQADEFITYYAPSFFPDKEFECKKLDGRRCQFISTLSTGQIDAIYQVLVHLDKRVHDQVIRERLYENDDPRFPGCHYVKEDPIPWPKYDFDGNWTRSFVVNPDEVLQVTWRTNSTGNRTRSKVAIKESELEEWVLATKQRLLIEWPKLKRNWETVHDAMLKSNNPQLQPYIDKFNYLLARYDQIPAAEFLRTIKSIRCSVDNSVLHKIFLECFPNFLSIFKKVNGAKQELEVEALPSSKESVKRADIQEEELSDEEDRKLTEYIVNKVLKSKKNWELLLDEMLKDEKEFHRFIPIVKNVVEEFDSLTPKNVESRAIEPLVDFFSDDNMRPLIKKCFDIG